MVVGNCHKQPDSLFTRQLLTVEEIVTEWECVLVELRKVNPFLKILFTVSPIRHSKDGMHGNQISKSTLLLAVDELCRRWSDCYYFPSYEIMMDELRDYRFMQMTCCILLLLLYLIYGNVLQNVILVKKRIE